MRILSLVPAVPDPFSGESTFHQRVIEGLRAAGGEVYETVIRGRDRQEQREQALAALTEAPDDSRLVVDARVVPSLVFALPAQRGRLRTVATFHRAAFASAPAFEKAALRAAEQDTYRHFDRVLTTSLPGAMALGPLGVLPDQIGLVLPAADPAPAAPGSEEGAFVMVGRLEPRKNHLLVLDALACCDQGTLQIIGSTAYAPEYVERLRGEIASRGLEGRVALRGALDGRALRGAFHGADLLIAADPEEAAGFAALQAIASGVPVLAAASGGLPKTLPSRGVLWSEPGSVEGIVQVLRRWLEDPDARSYLKNDALWARERVRRWTLAQREVARELDIADRLAKRSRS